MIQNALFRQCLAAIPEEQKAEFELSFGIAERISEVLKAKNLTQKDFAQKLHKRESEISKWLTQHLLHRRDVGSCRDGEGGCCMAAAVIGEVLFYPCLVLDAPDILGYVV